MIYVTLICGFIFCNREGPWRDANSFVFMSLLLLLLLLLMLSLDHLSELAFAHKRVFPYLFLCWLGMYQSFVFWLSVELAGCDDHHLTVRGKWGDHACQRTLHKDFLSFPSELSLFTSSPLSALHSLVW
jgi:hypothetical protein